MKFAFETISNFEDLAQVLSTGMDKLDFIENFQAAEITIEGATSGNSIKLRNPLNFVPSRFIIVDQTGNGVVARDENNNWTTDFLYLYNHGPSTVNLKALFLK
jgi:hypothetical protein